MVMEKKVKLQIKENVEPMMREVTTTGQNVFDVRGGGT